MKRLLGALIAVPMLFVMGCSANAEQSDEPAEKLKVITSFTILEDMVQSIGGDYVEVHNLVPTGTDPHEYEPLPDDLKAVSQADVLFYNGLNLEGGDTGWFSRMEASAAPEKSTVVEVSRDVEPMHLGEGEADSQVNPHAFIDPNVGFVMAETIRDGLIEADPDHTDEYQQQADEYLEKLTAIEAEYDETFDAIPEEERVLVTSERAFQYLADQYDITEYYIWEIDTDENGSGQQLVTLIDQLKGVKVANLIVESNVDRRPMEMVSAETGVPIFDRPIYSDEIGGDDAPEANTYLRYLEYNLGVLGDALTGK
ncbi:zinc ABC transporter substrate-binding protein [Leucobacter sp. UCMA 4100]|uniref:metal ABC transporter solute-binding protein, Zn/Mn family n=1 Tax=Leucobacter sp. UCMA 4100 TaxID=2810534 RepID=UPI0022EB96DB|nr:zinc ABC transporter substrate-binding protein [Leucobacter sp. UCMA 4100]MDA3146738.1 zinc ABC transporter substrate-binding protein [Leucobacter sp. UCMA 4100]